MYLSNFLHNNNNKREQILSSTSQKKRTLYFKWLTHTKVSLIYLLQQKR